MELEAFTTAARDWLADNAHLAPRDYGAILPPGLAADARAWPARLFEAGWAGIHWPIAVGGRGLSPDHTSAWVTECALAQVPAFVNMVGIVLAGGAILAFGTPEQQTEHLEPIIRGTLVWCQLFSEPEAGSDLASLQTTALADGDGFVVNGQKLWCSNGRVADRGILMARTDPSAEPHRGISFFLLDMSLAGIETRPLRQMNSESEFDEVFLTDVRLPAEALLGPLHGGWGVGMATLTNERGHIGAAGISLNRRLDALIALDADLGALDRNELVSLWSRGKSLWMSGRRQGPVASILGSVTKLGTTELMFDVACFMADRSGADSLLNGGATAQLLTAPGAKIAGGTSQIQRNLIGERILGLPREPKV